MAKRKKKEEEEEDVSFKFPEFDRNEFIQKEISQTKLSFAGIGLAIVLGTIAFILTITLNNPIIGLVVGFVGFGLIKPIGEKVADVSALELKDWLGHYAIYFLTFLAIWVLLFNYPITDVAHPDISNPSLYVLGSTDNSSIPLWVPVNDTEIEYGTDISIWANVTDNGKLASVSISIRGEQEIDGSMTEVTGKTFQFTVPENLPTGHYTYTITAQDEAGNSYTTEPMEFRIVPQSA